MLGRSRLSDVSIIEFSTGEIGSDGVSGAPALNVHMALISNSSREAISLHRASSSWE